MARPLRIEFPGAVYHVTARGNERRPVFWDDEDRRLFLSTLGRTVARWGWIVHPLGTRGLNGRYTQCDS